MAKSTNQGKKAQAAESILSEFKETTTTPIVSSDDTDAELANYLPEAAKKIAEEADLLVEFVEPLLRLLRVDPVKHHVPLVRVVAAVEDDLRLPNDPDEMTQEQIEFVRQMLADEVEACRLSDAERQDLAKYEALIDKGLRQSATALRAIRDGRLYREEYSSWDNYCSARWRFRGTTGDNKIAWLTVTELVEAKLDQEFRLGVVEAKTLLKLREHPDLLAAALLAADEKAATEDRKRQDADVAVEVERRLEYVRFCDVPQEMTLEEFETLAQAGISSYRTIKVIESVREKEAEGMSFEQALDATEEVIESRRKKVEAAKKAELEAVDAEIQAIQKKAKYQKLVNKKKAIKAEIADLKATTAPNSSESSSSSDDDEPVDEAGTADESAAEDETIVSDVRNSSLKVVSSDEAEPADETVTGNDTTASDVRQRLADAFKSLEDAFAGDWPEENAEELDRILAVAQKCEDKLAEITAKAKEYFADVEEPEAIPGE